MSNDTRNALVRHSRFFEHINKYKPEQLIDIDYMCSAETVTFFENELHYSCKNKLEGFFEILSDVSADADYFYNFFDIEFLILAFDFFMCDALYLDLIYFITKLNERDQFVLLNNLYYKSFFFK